MRSLVSVVILLLATTTLVVSQQREQSRSDCEAYVIAWNLAPADVHTLSDGPISITELDRRAEIMLGCSLTFAPMRDSQYRTLAEVYDHASNIRVEHFFQRHPEIRAKLLQDDEAGLR
jgi:hypothetical protein